MKLLKCYWHRHQAYLKHEFGCIQKMVRFPIQFHHLQSFILLKKMCGIFGKKRFNLLHVVGPGKFHCFVPLKGNNIIQSKT